MKHLILIPAMLLAGCGADGELYAENVDGTPVESEQIANIVDLLPFTASNIHRLGNGWVSFDFEGYRYLVSPTGGVAQHPFQVGGGLGH